MAKCRGGALLIAVAVAALLPATDCFAASTVGSECLASGFASDFTLLQLRKAPGSSPPVAAPARGVVTKWRVNSGLASILAEQLRVFRATGDPDEFQVIAKSRREPIFPGANAFRTRIPVRAGDRFGAYAASPSGALYCNSTDPADVMEAVHFDATVGSTHAFAPNPFYQVALSAAIEPDRDGDGYGDETQDECPEGATYHGECPRVRLHIVAKAKRDAIMLFVTASSKATVHVHGLVGRASLDAGTKHIGTAATTRFRVALPKSVLERLQRLAPEESLKAEIAARFTDLAGRAKVERLSVQLAGRARG